MEKLKQHYIQSLFVQEDEILASIHGELDQRDLPQISVPKEVGKLLYLLVKLSQAEKILEIGSLGGYSTIWLARALPERGRMITVDYRKEHLDVAAINIGRANLTNKVSLKLGEATQIMDQLIQEEHQVDFIFIDADKGNYPRYLEQAITLAKPGAIIVMDNLFFHGRVFDLTDQGDSPQKLRQTNKKLAEDPRLESILIPIGDGLGLARVKG